MIEAALKDRISALFAGNVFPDVAPEDAPLPYATYQQVGGAPVQFVGLDVPSKRNARVMVRVWATTRLQASQLARQVEDLLITSATLQATVLGALVAEHEPDTGLYGTRQDFSCWTDR